LPVTRKILHLPSRAETSSNPGRTAVDSDYVSPGLNPRKIHHWTIIDTPSVGLLTGVTIRADVVDGVVPVVEACKAEDGFFYIKNRSIVLDLYTIFETVKDLVSGGGS
jgi:hypothetical protein